jgi:serine/threonine-protein kinase
MTTLGCFFALGVWLTLRSSVRVPDVMVPELVDLDRLDAGRVLRDLGLEPQITGQRTDPLKPEGKVLEQFPAAGATTRPGRPVRLIVSSGPKSARFPDLVGSSLRRAQLALRNAGFRVATTAAVPHSRMPVGRVVSQHPRAGQAGFPGEAASLLLSSGREDAGYVMPALIGFDEESAERALGRAGFRRVRARQVGVGKTVIRQEPSPGHRVTRDSSILLDVGRRDPVRFGTGTRLDGDAPAGIRRSE